MRAIAAHLPISLALSLATEVKISIIEVFLFFLRLISRVDGK